MSHVQFFTVHMLILNFWMFFLFFCLFFFFNDTAPTEIYTLSLHDALPISGPGRRRCRYPKTAQPTPSPASRTEGRSEEHTSELQSRRDLVCRLLLEKKKKNIEQSCLH